MSKRADWKILKEFNKQLPGMDKIYTKLPLIVLDFPNNQNSEFYKNLMIDGNIKRSMASRIEKDASCILFTDFLMLIKYGDKQSSYFRCIVNHKDDFIKSFSVHVASGMEFYPGTMPCATWYYDNNYIIKEGWGRNFFINSEGSNRVNIIDDFSHVGEESETEIANYLTTFGTTVLAFFKTLSETDLYPVEVKGTQHRRRPAIAHDKKPWQRSDLVSIVFLNKLPTVREESNPLGGTHASPCYHQRRGHTHTMKDERFKNHPDYMKPIYRKPVWVGERETIVNGTTYKVI